VQKYGRAGAGLPGAGAVAGVDDPARVKELIGTAAVLEIDEVKDGPFPSREAALAQKGGVLPLNASWPRPSRAARRRAKSVPAGASGGDHGQRCATLMPARTNTASGKPASALSPDAVAGSACSPRRISGNKLAVVLDNQIVSVATIQSRIEDSGRITNLGSEEESEDLSRYLRSGRCRPV